MTKKIVKLLMISFVAVMFSACGDLGADVDNHLEVNGENFTLSTGIVDDLGTEIQETPPYRTYDITISSSSSYYAKNKVSFRLYSTSTTKIADGVYTEGYGAGHFKYADFQSDVVYDNTNEAISGTVISWIYLDDSYNNTITVSTEGEDKKYSFDLQFVKNGVTYEVKGSYLGALTDTWSY